MRPPQTTLERGKENPWIGVRGRKAKKVKEWWVGEAQGKTWESGKPLLWMQNAERAALHRVFAP